MTLPDELHCGNGCSIQRKRRPTRQPVNNRFKIAHLDLGRLRGSNFNLGILSANSPVPKGCWSSVGVAMGGTPAQEDKAQSEDGDTAPATSRGGFVPSPRIDRNSPVVNAES